ncbi:hypothetical protein AB0B25_01790 [Nocardia sp. NPDC049190]|uniref:hypothetical protein n=1 Tax=Nocardia sp. NPDC049190 TaxID=3155650 RepID=UPI0033C3E3A3
MSEHVALLIVVAAILCLDWVIFVGLPYAIDHLGGCHAAPEKRYSRQQAHEVMQELINCDSRQLRGQTRRLGHAHRSRTLCSSEDPMTTRADSAMWRHFYRKRWQEGAFRSSAEADFVARAHGGHRPDCVQYLSAYRLGRGNGADHGE